MLLYKPNKNINNIETILITFSSTIIIETTEHSI